MRFVPFGLRQALAISWLALAGLIVADSSTAQPVQQPQEVNVQPGANETFLAEDLDVERYVGIFEGESREIFVLRDRIAAALDLSPGAAVADIGAGTGVFLPVFDREVGAEGRVYAVDISPRFLDHLRDRKQREALTRVQVVKGSDRSVELPEASVDVAFMCDTYHHFEYPQSTLASLYSAIRPGGKLVIVDFERVPGKSRDWVLGHVRAGREVFRREIESAGFRFAGEMSIEGLEENYMLRFERP